MICFLEKSTKWWKKMAKKVLKLLDRGADIHVTGPAVLTPERDLLNFPIPAKILSVTIVL